MLWVGLWVEKVHEFCGNLHFYFPEIRSSVRIILRRRFWKTAAIYLSELGWSLLRRVVGSGICPEGSGVFRPNGLPLPVRYIG
jgi:hypothetical protein